MRPGSHSTDVAISTCQGRPETNGSIESAAPLIVAEQEHSTHAHTGSPIDHDNNIIHVVDHDDYLENALLVYKVALLSRCAISA